MMLFSSFSEFNRKCLFHDNNNHLSDSDIRFYNPQICDMITIFIRYVHKHASVWYRTCICIKISPSSRVGLIIFAICEVTTNPTMSLLIFLFYSVCM
jgi:hypothetical protein